MGFINLKEKLGKRNNTTIGQYELGVAYRNGKNGNSDVIHFYISKALMRKIGAKPGDHATILYDPNAQVMELHKAVDPTDGWKLSDRAMNSDTKCRISITNKKAFLPKFNGFIELDFEIDKSLAAIRFSYPPIKKEVHHG
jgi:hypothetical protein